MMHRMYACDVAKALYLINRSLKDDEIVVALNVTHSAMDGSAVIEYEIKPSAGAKCELILGIAHGGNSKPEDAQAAVVQASRPNEFKLTRILASGISYRLFRVERDAAGLDDEPNNWCSWAVVLCII